MYLGPNILMLFSGHQIGECTGSTAAAIRWSVSQGVPQGTGLVPRQSEPRGRRENHRKKQAHRWEVPVSASYIVH